MGTHTIEKDVTLSNLKEILKEMNPTYIPIVGMCSACHDKSLITYSKTQIFLSLDCPRDEEMEVEDGTPDLTNRRNDQCSSQVD